MEMSWVTMLTGLELMKGVGRVGVGAKEGLECGRQFEG
jgi:hypothetical protein